MESAVAVSLFRQADLERAIRGAQAVGLDVRAVEIGRDGAIRVLTRRPMGDVAVNDDDDWVTLAGQDGQIAARD
jgi:hypothetical protein